MKRNLRLAIALLLGAPGLSHALGLGDIHLSSALNQPLAADIDLLGATPEEVLQLRANLSSRETFTRYGIDRPAFLNSLTFKVVRDAGGRATLQVRSSDSITEPFVSFLVEVVWPRGRLIREYTLLLDPPVFESKQSAAPAVAAARTGQAPSAGTGTLARAAAPTPAPSTPAPEPTAAAATEGGDYRVAPNDSLSGIAHHFGASSPGDVNRLMVSTFRANPAAFDGNINRLRRGSVLHIPPSETWRGLSASEAAQEVKNQMSAWRAASGASAEKPAEEAHLRLVPPKDAGPGTGAGTGPAAREDAAKVAALEKELAETKRLLELRNADLARLAGKTAPAATPAPAPAPTPAPAPATKPAAQAPTPAPAAAPAPVAAPAPAPAAAPAATTPAPEPAAEAKPKPAPAKKPPAPPAEPGFFDMLMDNALYLVGGGALLALAALLGTRALRRRREASDDFDSAMQPDPDHAGSGAPFATTRTQSEADGNAIVVEESGEFTAPARAEERAPAVNTAEAAADQADPLAEADFHMAYGLYDQAADIVKGAISREPSRRDLKLKLLEVYFVWGNKDAFLDVARELGRDRDAGLAGEWDKVVIMGRQIAADDPLFAGAVSSAAGGAVDMDLDASGIQRIDLEFLGDTPSEEPAHDDAFDLHLGDALSGTDSTADTGQSRTLDPERMDLLLDEPPTDHSGATTREMRPSMDSVPVADQTIREKLDSALARERATSPTDATAELSLDDLGFDLDKLGASSVSLEALSATDHSDPTADHTATGTDHSSTAATMLANFDAHSKEALEAASRARVDELDPTRESTAVLSSPPEATRENPMLRGAPMDATHIAEPFIAEPFEDHAATAKGDLDLDLDELARALEGDTVEQPKRDEMRFSTDVFATAIRPGPAGLDMDVGAAGTERVEPTVEQHLTVDSLDLPTLEPVTLSEVGTKLDLARAYMDMGDPDGARSILQEVLSEGSATQKQEAKRLIESLPG